MPISSFQKQKFYSSEITFDSEITKKTYKAIDYNELRETILNGFETGH